MDTKSLIIHSAQEFIQRRGYNAFSFADIAGEVGIKTASVHHHFPSKADLGVEVIRQYGDRLLEQLQEVSRKAKRADEELQGLIKILSSSLSDGESICLCGMLMSDAETLPDEMRAELLSLIMRIEEWIVNALERGRNRKQFRFEGSPGILARSLFASFQGIMMCTRAHREPERFTKACRSLIALLETGE